VAALACIGGGVKLIKHPGQWWQWVFPLGIFGGTSWALYREQCSHHADSA